MADWLIAATAAGMPGMVEEKPKYARATYTEQRYVVDETAEYSTAWDLPSVDDLEVAAAAAAAALDIFAPPPKAVSSDEDSSDEDSDDEEDGDSPMTAVNAPTQTHTMVRVKLAQISDAETPAGEGRIQLQLSYAEVVTLGSSTLAAATLAGARRFVRGSAAAAAAAACETQADSSPLASSDESSSSDDDDEVTSGKGGLIMGLDEMRAMITKACEIVDDDEEGGGGGGGDNVKLGGMKEALGLPEITPLDVEVGLNDAIQPAGIVMSVMDGMIVLMGSANAPVLSEGSVLVLGDRTPVGRVEEVFGPVATPFYALRYAGAVGSAIPASIAPGSPMFSVLKFSTFISPDELVSSSTAAPARPIKVEGDTDPDSDEEVYFSDDEKEAEYQKTQHSTKRRAGEAPLGRGEGGGPHTVGGGGRGRGSRAGAPGSSQERGGSSDRGRGRHGSSDRGGRGGRGAGGAAASSHSRPPYGSTDPHKRPGHSEGHTMTSTYSQPPPRHHNSSGPPPSSSSAPPSSSPSSRQPPSGPAPPTSRQPPPPHPSQQQSQPHHPPPQQYQQHPHPQQYPGYPAGPPGPWGPQYAMPPPGYGMPPPHGAYMYQHGPPPQGGGYPVNPNQPPPQYHPYQHPQYPQGQAPPYNPYGNAPPAGYPPQQQWPAPGPGGR